MRYIGTHDRDYFSWLDPTVSGGTIYVNYLDHTTHAVGTPVSLATGVGTNVHSSPIIYVIPSGAYAGRIVVCWYGYVKRSTNVEDISSWAATVNLPLNTPYPSIFQMGNGNIGIITFSDMSPPYAGNIPFYVSTDGCDSFDAGTTIISAPTKWFYPMAIAWGNTIHVAGTISEPGVSGYHSCYYMYSPDNGTTWKKRDGTVITLPATEATLDVVLSQSPPPATDPSKIWPCDLQVDSSGSPIIAYETPVDDTTALANIANYYSGAWHNHSVGVNTLIYDFGYVPTKIAYSTCLFIDPNDTSNVYIGVRSSATSSDIQKWHTPDEGVTWSKTADITTGSTVILSEPKPFKNSKTGFDLLYTIIRSWTNYATWTADLAFHGYSTTIQPPTKDAEIFAFTPTYNFGALADFDVIANATFRLNSLLEFNVAAFHSIPLLGVDLVLDYYNWLNANPVGRTIRLDRLRRADWVEGVGVGTGAGYCNWVYYKDGSSPWGTVGAANTSTDIDTSLSATILVPKTFGSMVIDVTQLVKDAIANQSDVFRVRIIDASPDSNSFYQTQWYSKEYTADPTKQPALVATQEGPPVVASVTPNSGQQGQTISSVTLVGNSFIGATAVSFGSGITVSSFMVDTDTQVTASITIDPAATPGMRDVSVTAPGGVGVGTDLFEVLVFTTIVDFGAGITVSSFTVDNPNQITADILIDPAATPGARDVLITTAFGTGALYGGFKVMAPACGQSPSIQRVPGTQFIRVS
jgi:hypothetical protein